jgi:hypothetical protein
VLSTSVRDNLVAIPEPTDIHSPHQHTFRCTRCGKRWSWCWFVGFKVEKTTMLKNVDRCFDCWRLLARKSYRQYRSGAKRTNLSENARDCIHPCIENSNDLRSMPTRAKSRVFSKYVLQYTYGRRTFRSLYGKTVLLFDGFYYGLSLEHLFICSVQKCQSTTRCPVPQNPKSELRCFSFVALLSFLSLANNFAMPAKNHAYQQHKGWLRHEAVSRRMPFLPPRRLRHRQKFEPKM